MVSDRYLLAGYLVGCILQVMAGNRQRTGTSTKTLEAEEKRRHVPNNLA